VIEEAIYTRLSGFSALTTLLGGSPGTGIYPQIVPQNATYPCVVFQRISGERVSAMGSDSGLARLRLQVSSYADTYSDAKTVAEQVRTALQRHRATIGAVVVQDIYIEGEVDIYEPDTKKHRVSQDYDVAYEE